MFDRKKMAAFVQRHATTPPPYGEGVKTELPPGNTERMRARFEDENRKAAAMACICALTASGAGGYYARVWAISTLYGEEKDWKGDLECFGPHDLYFMARDSGMEPRYNGIGNGLYEPSMIQGLFRQMTSLYPQELITKARKARKKWKGPWHKRRWGRFSARNERVLEAVYDDFRRETERLLTLSTKQAAG